MLATRRVRYYRRSANGNVTDTGWELVQYPGHGEMWEPADTVVASGGNGPSKVITGVQYVSDRDMGSNLNPLNSSVFYPRTGTAAT